MMRYLRWLKAWFSAVRQVHAIDTVEASCQAAFAARERAEERLKERLAEFSSLRARVAADLDFAEKVGRLHDNTVEELRHELKVAKDVTIPALVASHKLLLQRYDAETSIQVRRQIAAGPGAE